MAFAGQTRVAHRGRREGAVPGGAAAHRRSVRGRRRPHQAPRLPALPARDQVEQATGRAEDLPQLLCPRPRGPLREMRNSTRTGRPRRPGPPVVPVLPGQRSGQPRRLRPMPPPQTGQHPHARRAGLRDLQPARHLDLQQLRTHRPLHGLQDHRPAAVRSMCPFMGTVLKVRAARPGPCRHA